MDVDCLSPMIYNSCLRVDEEIISLPLLSSPMIRECFTDSRSLRHAFFNIGTEHDLALDVIPVLHSDVIPAPL